MKSQEYWRKRSEQIANRQFEKADRYEAGLRRQYELSLKSIQRDIDSFYARFAENNAVSMAEARRLLSAGELVEFKMTLSEFRKKAKNNADSQWTKELDNVYYRTRVLGQRLTARDFDSQIAEIHVRIAILNRFTVIGTPLTHAVG